MKGDDEDECRILSLMENSKKPLTKVAMMLTKSVFHVSSAGQNDATSSKANMVAPIGAVKAEASPTL
jgi:hypothetical protein